MDVEMGLSLDHQDGAAPPKGARIMNKRELIDQINRLNHTAHPDFLATFSEEELVAYLQQLRELERERRRQGQLEPALV